MMLKFKHYMFIFLISVISKTWRIEVCGSRIGKENAIIAFWHGSMLPVWKYFARYKAAAIVSQSKDGAILSKLLENWSYFVARGSSSKGGKEALEQIVELAKEKIVLITPDGPRGEIYKFKAGAVVAAQRSGAELFLCGVEINKAKIFTKSWDKFAFPMPFSKIILTISEAIIIPKQSSREEVDTLIMQCEEQLNKLNKIS